MGLSDLHLYGGTLDKILSISEQRLPYSFMIEHHYLEVSSTGFKEHLCVQIPSPLNGD